MLGDRININELNKERVSRAIKRRLTQIANIISWNIPTKLSIENKKRLDKLSNIHNNERCFLIANGPSLTITNLSNLKNEITFGMNRINLLFPKMDFVPNYYVCDNELVLDQFHSEISKIMSIKFINWSRRHLFLEASKCHYLNYLYRINDVFISNPRKLYSGGGTVTFTALQLIFFMGFSEVIIVGLDHNFKDKGIPNIIEKRNQDQDLNHFDPNYFPKGIKWQLPDIKRSEYVYNLANKEFMKCNRKIYDATINGNCTIFEKLDFNTITFK